MSKGAPAEGARESRRSTQTQIDRMFADALSSRRKNRGWSLADVSDLMREEGIKYHPTTVNRNEKGDRRVPLGEALVLSRILGIDVSGLGSGSTPHDAYGDGYRSGIKAAQKALAEL